MKVVALPRCCCLNSLAGVYTRLERRPADSRVLFRRMTKSTRGSRKCPKLRCGVPDRFVRRGSYAREFYAKLRQPHSWPEILKIRRGKRGPNDSSINNFGVHAPVYPPRHAG